MTYLSDDRLAEILRDAELNIWGDIRAPTREDVIALVNKDVIALVNEVRRHRKAKSPNSALDESVTTPMTDLELADLRAKAEAAAGEGGRGGVFAESVVSVFLSRADAAHIAAFDPHTAKALVEEVLSCRAEHQDMAKRMGLLHADLIQVQDENEYLALKLKAAAGDSAALKRMVWDTDEGATLTVNHWASAVLAEHLAREFVESGAVNYLTMRFGHTPDDPGPLEVTIRCVHGKSPAQVVDELKDERDALKAERDALKAEVASLRERGDCEACAEGFPCERNDVDADND